LGQDFYRDSQLTVIGADMKFMNFGKAIKAVALGSAILLGASGTAAFATDIEVSYLAPGVQNPSAFTSYYETFTGAS
jgi:hypothetical protein